MKKTAMLALMLALCLLCGGAQALTMTGLETDVVDRQWETNAFFPRMEALTGVTVVAHGISDPAEYAQLLSAMEKGDVAYEVLFKAGLSREQEAALLESGAIIDLAPHIEANMPNLHALLEQNPQWREIITLEDGRIASLPMINPHERQVMLWINQTWLDRLGVAAPQTLSELTDALQAIRTRDPNGNGRKDEQALDLLGVYEMRWLLPYFGVVADDYNLARDAQGQIVFAPQMPEYRAFIAQLKAWREAGLLRKDAFTGTHNTLELSQEKEETATSGVLLSASPFTHVPIDAVTDYVPLLLAGPDCSVRWRDLLGEIWTGCFAVTSKCADVASALRWADALYGEAGALLAYAGVEDEDYYFTGEGYWAFLLTQDQDVNGIRANSVIYTGAATPGIYPMDFIRRVDSAPDRHVFAASEQAKAVSEQVTAAYTLPLADQRRADELAAVLGGLVDTGIARFVTGETPLTDESYAAWLSELEAAGSAELVSLYAGK